MSANADDLIVHLYDAEPAFSVKTRLMLGYKNAQWFACNHPTILPKPDLAALTGGYRQIPVLQIGADIFCGSELITDELDRRIGDPALARLSGNGIGRGIAYWAEETLFWVIVQVLCASDFKSAADPDFDADRRRMLPGVYDVGKMKAALPANLQLLRAHLDLLERQLADGRAFMLGEESDLVDISLYFPIDMLSHCRNGNENIPQEFPGLARWMGRVAALGHGRRAAISRADALAVAKAAPPTIHPCSTVSEGPQPGDRVRVIWAAYSPVDLTGEVVETHPRRLAVRHTAPEVDDVVVHFPRTACKIEA